MTKKKSTKRLKFSQFMYTPPVKGGPPLTPLQLEVLHAVLGWVFEEIGWLTRSRGTRLRIRELARCASALNAADRNVLGDQTLKLFDDYEATWGSAEDPCRAYSAQLRECRDLAK